MTDSASKAREIACRLAIDVAELPDRTSPDDYPNHLLVTAGELIDMVEGRLARALDSEWNAGVEAATAWHRDGERNAMNANHVGSSNDERRQNRQVADWHKAAAEGLVALKRPAQGGDHG